LEALNCRHIKIELTFKISFDQIFAENWKTCHSYYNKKGISDCTYQFIDGYQAQPHSP